MVGEADVTIRYAFLPTESSIREGAQKVIKTFNEKAAKQKWGSGIYSEAYHKRINEVMKSSVGKIGNEYKNTTDSIINLLRATQQKTSLQTKILSGMKFLEGKGITGGISGGEGVAGAAGAGAGGGMMAALGTIAALLGIIAVAMTLISAFFDAVGPIIKVVMKMISAMILILLMPFLKRGLPVLFDILKWMIEGTKTISGFVDSFMTYIEKLLGKAMGGDPMAIFELLVGPLGMLVIFLGKKLVEFLAAVDWKAIVDAVIPMLQNAFSVVMEFINTIGKAVFGKQMWLQIIQAVNLIREIFSEGGVWKTISKVIDDIGETIFGETTWNNIKELINASMILLVDSLTNVANAVQGVAVAIVTAWNAVLGWAAPVSSPSSQSPLTSNLNNLLSKGIFPKGGFSGGSSSAGTFTPGSNPGLAITNNLSVSAGVDRKEFSRILTDFSRQQGRELRNRTSYYGG